MASVARDPVKRDRLFKAIRHHYEQLESYRDLRDGFVADYAGSLYAKSKCDKSTVLNLMAQAAEAHTIGISANRPKAAIYAKSPDKVPFARHFQVALNNLAKQMKIEQTFQAIALDSFFGPAFGKVYLGDAPAVQIEEDLWMDPGQPHFARISFDDMVYDTQAKDFRKCTFIGDRYRLPWRVVQEDHRFNAAEIAKIARWHQGDGEESNNAEYLSKELEQIDEGDYEPMVDGLDLWLPEDGMVYTWLMRPGFHVHNSPPIAEQEWTGAETGPIHMFCVGDVPDNILPSSPAQHLKYTFDLTNVIYRKLARQAERLKVIGTYDPGDEEYAQSYKDADDGDVVCGKGIAESRTGGVDNNLASFGQLVTNIFDRAAGNLALRAGLGPQTDTAAQDKLLSLQVTRIEAGAQNKMIRFATEVFEELARLLFDDPVLELPGEIPIEGTPFTVTSDWKSSIEEGAREGRYTDYDYCVEAASMPYQSSAQKLNTIKQTVMEMVPLLPILQEQGIQFDMAEYLKLIADGTDTPEIQRVFKTQQIPVQVAGGSAHERSMPSSTQRNYTRTNRGSGAQSPTSNEALLSQMQSSQQMGAA